MNKPLLLPFFLFLFLNSFAQPGLNQWTWVKGDNYTPLKPVYGNPGVAAASNKPGDRQSAVTWTDPSGNLWMFGGVNVNGYNQLNELWKYDPVTGWWTWISGNNSQAGRYGTKGVADAANGPGARYGAVGWTDAPGNLWLFGGRRRDALNNGDAYCNDLWKYVIATGLWTWMGGDSTVNQGGIYGAKGTAAGDNKPGSRYSITGWTDKAGNFWLFGGYGTSASDVGYLNDLWKYSVFSGLWTWISGDNVADQPGSYGTKGLAAPANKPDTRTQSVSWTDTSGNLWLFGGLKSVTVNNNSTIVSRNDLWKYSVSSGLWTWISGDNTYNQPGVYGTRDAPATGNKPGARGSSVAWADTMGNLWMLGGDGYTASAGGGLNDVWKYVPSSGLWTWVSGDSTVNKTGVYGVRNTSSPASKPGAKNGALGWTTAAGDLWLFGGNTVLGGNSNGGVGTCNDLWTYITATGQWTWMGGDTSAVLYGAYGTRGSAAPGNKPGSRGAAAGWADGAGNLWLFGGNGAPGSGNTGYLNDLWKYSVPTGQWSWISGDSSSNPPGIYGTRGVPAASNKPPPRFYALTWTDASGKLWLFGGNAIIPGYFGSFNDLWMFDPATGLWTWMSGDNATSSPGVYGTKGTAAAGNKPGSRDGATGWADASGNLWLFGGVGYAANMMGPLNDLWKYTVTTGLWTWVSGDNTISQSGVYGPLGTASASSKPGARGNASGWIDASGNLWLFGGYGAGSSSSGWLNDLWKYTPSSGLWTYAGGSNSPNASGVYGTKGIAAPGNQPGARQYAPGWTDAAGNLWLFGGEGQYVAGNSLMNDLWKYNPLTNRWAWMSGDNFSNQPGVYGTQGAAAASNKPGARSTAVSWTDVSGNLWLFGGSGYTSNGVGNMNDLWKYTLSGSALPVQFTGFTARRQQQTVVLNWTTAREQNSRSFTVERSADGTRYDSIGYVPAANASSGYSFTDKEPLAGTGFYRVKQVDRDEKFLYSAVIRTELQDRVRFAVSYNQGQRAVQLHLELPEAAKLQLQIRDISGHLVWSGERLGIRGSSVYTIPVEYLARGTYLVNMKTGKESRAKTFVKQ